MFPGFDARPLDRWLERWVKNFYSQPGHLGLIGANDATTPNTKFTISSTSTTYINSLGVSIKVVSGVVLTGDISVVGLGGRDQAAAFAASAKVNWFKVYSGSVEYLVASLNAPSVGPAVSSGTSWAYACTVVLDGSGNMRKMYVAGNKMHFQARQLILNASSNGAEQSVSYASFVPTFAISICLAFNGSMGSAGAVTALYNVRLVSAIDYFVATVISDGSPGFGSYPFPLDLPNLPGQAILQAWGAGPSSVISNIGVLSFTIPNGAI